MKYLIIIVLLALSQLASAGPAIDRAKAAMEAFKGAPVSNAVALIVVTQWAKSVEPRQIPSIVCETLGEDELCITTWSPDPWNNEELAQLYLNKHYSFDLRQYNQYRRDNMRAVLRSKQAVLDAQVKAEVVTDL